MSIGAVKVAVIVSLPGMCSRLRSDRRTVQVTVTVTSPPGTKLLVSGVMTAGLQLTGCPASAAWATCCAWALAGQSVSCDPAVITPDTGDFVPGGEVTVTVTCTVRLSDLSLLHVPGTETIASTFTAPIDTYRGNTLGFSNPDAPALSLGTSSGPPATAGGAA